ncbi:MAG TPA: hypothetical protein VFC07_08105 [Verrucomicrobiae bacterium]|nr:hypothetical protein [Verrucomicrobiae bacterium]
MNLHKFNAILITLGCGLLLAAATHAQDTNAPRTELDAFESRAGVVIVRGSSDVGAVTTAAGTVLVRCKESVEAGSGRKQHGIAVTLTGKDQQSDTTIVDYDELGSFLSGLDFLADANWSLTTLQYFDAVYTTRDGLQAAAYSSKQRPGTLGASFKSSRMARVRVSLSPQDFALFRGLIQQAKSRLDALRGGK